MFLLDALKASKSKCDISKEIETLMADSYNGEPDYLFHMVLKAIRIKLSIEKINQNK